MTFEAALNLTDIELTLVIDGDSVEKLEFTSSSHNSTFHPLAATTFGVSPGYSYACNGSFSFTHGYDTLTVINVVFEANKTTRGFWDPQCMYPHFLFVLLRCMKLSIALQLAGSSVKSQVLMLR